MEFVHDEYRLPSKVNKLNIYVQSITPADKNEVKSVILIVHGMVEHSNRYIDAAKYLCQKGYAVYMYDQAGHGKSINSREDLGFFSDKDGSEKITDDVKSVAELAKKQYGNKKIIIWGHSMGSFVTRRFIAKYPGLANAAILCGTSGSNPAVSTGIALANFVAKIKGPRYRSKFLNTLAFGAYNKKFIGSTGFEWLSVNEENIKKYIADENCGFLFTSLGFRDLFTLLKNVNSKEWYAAVPSGLPIYLISGEMDPVGNYGKGVTEVYNKLKESGHTKVSMKLYKNLRHEIHNEKSNAEVYEDIAAFADKII